MGIGLRVSVDTFCQPPSLGELEFIFFCVITWQEADCFRTGRCPREGSNSTRGRTASQRGSVPLSGSSEGNPDSAARGLKIDSPRRFPSHGGISIHCSWRRKSPSLIM